MSFAQELKLEIYKARPIRGGQRLAFAYGLLLFSRSFGMHGVSIQTELEETARLFCRCIEDGPGIESSLVFTSIPKRNGAVVYTASVESEEDRLRVLSYFGHRADELSLRVRKELIASPEARQSFISGAYLACGNMIDPRKHYHLEFVTPHRGLCEDLMEALREIVSQPKLTQRRSSYVVYIKESESIEDLMTYMGGQKCALEMMEIKIFKDVRNKVNRTTNCETANLDKTVAAAFTQVEDIEFLEGRVGIEGLPEELQELARLRLESPDMSLRELGEALSLSRSGVNHRLKRLSALADSMRHKPGDRQ